jgi:hypothetical protein
VLRLGVAATHEIPGAEVDEMVWAFEHAEREVAQEIAGG